MRVRTLIWVAILLLGLSLSLSADSPLSSRHVLAAVGDAQMQAGAPAPALAQPSVIRQASSGGSYTLVGPAQPGWQASLGGDYRLSTPSSPTDGTPCCCNYLPCIRK